MGRGIVGQRVEHSNAWHLDRLTSFLSMSIKICLAPPLASSFASHMLTTPFPAPRSAAELSFDDPAAPAPGTDDGPGEEVPELRTAREIFQLPQ